MVNQTVNIENILSTIRMWIESLPQHTTKITIEESGFEYVISMKPFKSEASGIEIRIGKYDETFTVGVGKNIQFDEIPLSEDLIIEILEVVKQGNLKEITWEYQGRLLGSKGELQLASETWYSDRRNFWRNCWYRLFRKPTMQSIHYEPWE